MAYRLHPRRAMRVPTFAQQDLALRIGQRAFELEDPRGTGVVGAALGRAAAQVFDDVIIAGLENWKQKISASTVSPAVEAQDKAQLRRIRQALVWIA